MKVGAIVLAVLLLLIGGTFAGQGLGYIPGSFMTGDMKWFWIGGAMVIAGLAAGAWAILGRRSPRQSHP
jgi:hypothetical protein